MSDTDSFIDEVSEEVRRDKLYGYLRRYGWIAVLLILGLVGGATYNEWSKAQAAEAAQALGDQLLDALEVEDPESRASALSEIETETGAGAVVALLQATEQERSGDVEGAIATLDSLAADSSLGREYRDLAQLKSLLLSDGIAEPDARRAGFEAMAVPGQPYRLLALEQLALLDVAAGETAAAVETLTSIVEDAEVTGTLRDRAQGLIIALGGSADAATE